MPRLTDIITKDGYYRVKVTTKQPVCRVTKQLADGTIKISLSSAPEKGKANAELLLFVARELALRREQVRLVSGITSPLKVIHIEGLSP